MSHPAYIEVTARGGKDGAISRAGRRLMNGVTYRFEVVPDEPTRVFPPLWEQGTSADAPIWRDGPPNPHAPFDVNGQPAMDQICEASLRQLEGDPRIAITPDERFGQTTPGGSR